MERTGLMLLVLQPTRGHSVLGQVYVSNPLQYSIVRVVTSTVKSDQKAVVLSAASYPVPQFKSICPVNNIPVPKTHFDFRPKSITPVLTGVIERIVVGDYNYIPSTS